jgi:hypothetical protein
MMNESEMILTKIKILKILLIFISNLFLFIVTLTQIMKSNRY